MQYDEIPSWFVEAVISILFSLKKYNISKNMEEEIE